jgi:hypothetical protein
MIQAPGLKEAEKHKEEFILFFFLNVDITGGPNTYLKLLWNHVWSTRCRIEFLDLLGRLG